MFHLANCRTPLGIGDGRIRDISFEAPTAFNNNFQAFGPQRARLGLQTWAPGYRADPKDTRPNWIRVDFDQEMVVTAIATQGYGDPHASEWVESFMLLYRKRMGSIDYFKNSKGEIQVSSATEILGFPSHKITSWLWNGTPHLFAIFHRSFKRFV